MTEEQSKVGAALERLGCEMTPTKVMGGPVEYPITDAMIEKLKEHVGESIVVEGDASTKWRSKPR